MAARADALLTKERLTVYPVTLLAVWIVSYSAMAVLDRSHTPLPDFAARWTAGRMLLDGQAGVLYDPVAQSALQQTELHSTALSWFVSPPIVAAAAIPLSAIPYAWACVVWSVVSCLCLVVAAWLLKPFAPPALRNRRALVILVAAAPTLELLGSGQDTSVCLLAVAGGIRLLDKGWPLAAGLALAIGTIKPHLMLLVPFVLLAQRATRALLWFCVGSILLLAAGWAVIGPSGLLDWLRIPFSSLYTHEVILGQAWKSPSLTGFLLSLPPTAPRWWLTAASSLALATAFVAANAWRTQRRRRSPFAVWGLALLTTAVSAPHVMLYDLVVVMPALILLVGAVWDATTRALLAGTYVLLWLTASLHSVASHLNWPFSLIGLPWGALGVLAVWLRTVRVTTGEPVRGMTP